MIKSREAAQFLRFKLKGWSSSYEETYSWPIQAWSSITLNEVDQWEGKDREWDPNTQSSVFVDPKIGEEYTSYWTFEAHFVSDFDVGEPHWSHEGTVSQAEVMDMLNDDGVQPWYLWGGYFRVPIVSDIITALSPVEIHVYDQYGRHVGPNASGGIDVEIPGAWYIGSDEGPKTILLSNSTLEYQYEVIGEEAGEYQLGIMKTMNVTDQNGEAVNFLMEVFHAPTTTSTGEVHAYQYDFEGLTDQINSLTDQGWTIEDALNIVIYELDTDNDGVPDVLDPYPMVNKAPTITTTQPEEGMTVSGTVTVEGTAMDPEGNQTLQQVEARFNTGDWRNTEGTSAWSYVWNTEEFANGPNTIEVRAWDGTHYSPSSSITLTVQNQTAVWTQWWFWTLLILAIGLAVTIYLMKAGMISLQFNRFKLR
ncbi:MAG: Ig-like domain-containing protein [Candidatus Bathyarchaeota archaeon]|nr:Ig-like domain-containing protein [Candidatus Bathyarchaeota archaeon]